LTPVEVTIWCRVGLEKEAWPKFIHRSKNSPLR
jgi:hypothetical protein